MKRLILILIAISILPVSVFGEAVSSKAYKKRVELLVYLRALEPIVKNYKGEVPGGQNQQTQPAGGNQANAPEADGDRIKKYKELKRLYQEGLQYFFENNHVNSYRRFLEAQLGTEMLLEELSQYYVERTEEILKAAIEKKNQNNPEDKNLVDIAIELSKTSYIVKDMTADREAPLTRRMYNPRDFHYVTNKYAIEKNMETGYKFLGLAKEARNNALKIEKHLEKHQKLQPSHRKHRIEQYLGAIQLCRDARANAINIFKLKYPYDNYFLFKSDAKTEAIRDDEGKAGPSEPVLLQGVTYDFSQNPTLELDHRLSPVFDRRIPEEYRRDAVDVLEKIYEDEVKNRIFLKWDPEKRKQLMGDKAPAGK
ncbi:hypothetical protein EHQ12_05960 [Leptospira gomenensis]|uniref:Uncharacterized protein n=1 Tax=Leptospira gomenensis TaxID=2484974 RepID=A0A5F1Y7R4_9LEPT|nr:hypothetical protein [Leptospira gomenensis]TGK30978.1 hypothetical protein EHQ17_14765 [Leptospira gomenensis]TGK41734.1 hypothetical protein EHQ12_05960 [Leptospira gomenensis]TGK45302.1 hypothetical protein EHQ07_10235 [Leptospira gomenensis]TGK66216.1 hypothetical protein EHQ13_03970 [Leptospira gomenensis]